MRGKGVAITIIAILLPIAIIVLANTPPSYLYSDHGDIVFYKELSSKIPLKLGGAWEGEVIAAIDLNYEFMNQSSRKTLTDLVKEAYNGKTVIIGYNTIRAIQTADPTAFQKIGARVTYSMKGVIDIQPQHGLQFTPLKYDASKYGMAIINAPQVNIIIESGEEPILEEIPVGKGRLIVLAINPVEPYLETRDPAYPEFTAAVLKYYSSKRPSTILAATAAIITATAAYLSLSSNQRVERLRNIIKWAIVSGGFKLMGREVLENKLRKAIYDYINERGYTTVNDIAHTFNISRSNARWHLQVLLRAGLIKATSIQNSEIYHPPGYRSRAVREFLLENKLRRKIYEQLLKGKSISEIARTLGISKSTVSHHARVLREFKVLED